MKIFLVLTVAFSTVHSEAGYNYQQPPVIVEAKNSAFNSQQSSRSGYNYQRPPVIVEAKNSAFNSQQSSRSSGYNYQPPIVQSFRHSSHSSGPIYQLPIVQDLRSNSLPQSLSAGYSYPSPNTYNQAPIVQKHVYVHVAPEETQTSRHRSVPILPPPQKNYKIIFIKAPTPPTYSAPLIPLNPQNEEKTLIYVLVKKPEQQPDVFIPRAAATPPSKPEVFFIKYRTQKETVGGHPIGPGPINNGPVFGSGGPSFDDTIVVNNPTRQQLGGSINLQSGSAVISEGLSGIIPTGGSFSGVSSFTSQSSSTQGLGGSGNQNVQISGGDLPDFIAPTISGPTISGSTISGLTLASSSSASESDSIRPSPKAPSANYGVPSN